MLARFVVGSHMRHHPNLSEEERVTLIEQLSEIGTGRVGSSPDLQPLSQVIVIMSVLYTF